MNTAIAHDIEIQVALELSDEEQSPPASEDLVEWASLALSQEKQPACEVTLRLVGAKEMADLNELFRGKHGTTNVLSFPFEMNAAIPPSEFQSQPIGDVVICHDVVCQEASEQKKLLDHHYAHMVTHGILHLCGYDHIHDHEANIMESREVQLLAEIGVPNPYLD